MDSVSPSGFSEQATVPRAKKSLLHGRIHGGAREWSNSIKSKKETKINKLFKKKKKRKKKMKNSTIVFTVSKFNPGGCLVVEEDAAVTSLRPQRFSSGFDGAGDHAVWRVWKLRRHGRHLAARRVRARTPFRETDLRDTKQGSDAWTRRRRRRRRGHADLPGSS